MYIKINKETIKKMIWEDLEKETVEEMGEEPLKIKHFIFDTVEESCNAYLQDSEGYIVFNYENILKDLGLEVWA